MLQTIAKHTKIYVNESHRRGKERVLMTVVEGQVAARPERRRILKEKFEW